MADDRPDHELTLDIDWETEGAPVYANGVRVSCNETDVALVFTEFQALPGRAAAAGSTVPRERIVSSIRVTPDNLFRMVASFASTWNRYVLQHGKPDAMPRFKLFGRDDLQLDGVGDPED